MTCGPVLIQWLAAVGLAAYGSVLLASVPPASMYMRPIFPAGGVWWCRYASIHAPAFLSQHIGSGPGVSGLSGMHVKPLLPLRSVRSEEHTSELQSQSNLVCRLLLEKKKYKRSITIICRQL